MRVSERIRESFKLIFERSPPRSSEAAKARAEAAHIMRASRTLIRHQDTLANLVHQIKGPKPQCMAEKRKKP